MESEPYYERSPLEDTLLLYQSTSFDLKELAYIKHKLAML